MNTQSKTYYETENKLLASLDNNNNEYTCRLQFHNL